MRGGRGVILEILVDYLVNLVTFFFGTFAWNFFVGAFLLRFQTRLLCSTRNGIQMYDDGMQQFYGVFLPPYRTDAISIRCQNFWFIRRRSICEKPMRRKTLVFVAHSFYLSNRSYVWTSEWSWATALTKNCHRSPVRLCNTRFWFFKSDSSLWFCCFFFVSFCEKRLLVRRWDGGLGARTFKTGK